MAISSSYLDHGTEHGPFNGYGGSAAAENFGNTGEVQWHSEWQACHESCCPSLFAALCCPCFSLSRIKAAFDIRAGTFTSKFLVNVTIIAIINIWQLQRLWLPLVPGATTKECSFSEYFSDVGLAGEGSIGRCLCGDGSACDRGVP